MKRVLGIIATLLCVLLVCGAFYFVKQKADPSAEDNIQLTNVQKLTTRNLESNYPQTPREVVKYFNKIITCYYNETYTDDELKRLTEQAWTLFDQELQEKNPLDQYLKSVQADVADYKERGRSITQTSVCDSNDVRYFTDKGDELAYVTASYFIKEKKEYKDTNQMYVLRKDEDGNWRILVFYQIEEEASEEE